MSTAAPFDLVVVGAGIVGAATAREYQIRNPGAAVALVEKETLPGQHQSSHNSGVIHAGVYYKPGSLKARLCIDGRKRMLEFCDEHDVPVHTTGKLIVAINEGERERLRTLHERAVVNGVPESTLMERDGIRNYEPHAAGVAALHVPTTAITDFAVVTRRMVEDVQNKDGDVRFGFDVAHLGATGDVVAVRNTEGDELRAKRVVVCTGTQVDRTQSLLVRDDDFAIVPFRGAYYDLSPQAAALVKGLIYPVPDPQFPFLGIHLTRHIDDSVSAGPNAVLSLARAARGRMNASRRDIQDVLRFPGTWQLARKYWRMGGQEFVRDLSKRLFARATRNYLPDLEARDLHNYHFGVRAQAVQRSGALIEDFDFARSGNVLFVRNAPSPAATASLAIASHIIDTLQRKTTS